MSFDDPTSREYLDGMTDGYLECEVWADEPRDENGEVIENIGYHADAMAEAESDCADFLTDPEVVAALVAGEWGPEQAGHDFYLTRNSHGAGFWDRGKGEPGDILTAKAHTYGSTYLHVDAEGWLRHG